MDMLNADLALCNEASTKMGKARGKKKKKEEEEPGFHFIAFVPIQGSVWKLDGLDRQPMKLGEFRGNWMDLARPIIEERMQRYEGDQIQFSLLSLGKSPLLTAQDQLAINIRAFCMVEEQLSICQPDWNRFIETEESGEILREANMTYGISIEQLEAAILPQSTLSIINDPTTVPSQLFEMRRDLADAQIQLKASLLDEVAAARRDEERALGRRHDYTPVINTWLKMLAGKGVLKDLILGG